MSQEKFSTYAHAPGMPAMRVIEIVPSDETDLPEVALGLNVATPGTVRVTTQGGSMATVFVAAGHVFPIRVRRVWESGTTATGIAGLI